MRRVSPYDVVRDRIRKILFLIRSLDRIRAGLYSDLSKVEEVIEELGLSDHPVKWDDVLSEAKEIAKIPRKDPSFKNIDLMVRISSSMTFLGIIEVIISTVLMFTGMAPALSFSLLLSAFMVTNISYVLRTYASSKIKRIYLERKEEVERHGEVLKRAVDSLLIRLRSELKKIRRLPSEVRIKLMFADYSNIKVVKKPSRFRRSYVVTLVSR